MSLAEKLRAVPILAGLTEAQIEAILGVVTSRRVAADTVIVREGDEGKSLFILTEGSVEVTKRLGLGIQMPTEGSREKLLVSLDAPQFFGEMGLLEDTERSATITTRGGCELVEITHENFERLAELDPLLGYRVLRNIAVVLSSRLRRTDRDVVKLTMALSLALGIR
ncbi:MAG: cyclic nucleotide-binding domain-containing protein [Dehalococcoidia bacterium]|nr:cyclic nucleotide-binding domain-containing protein [Dehalococcoidia bacterium]